MSNPVVIIGAGPAGLSCASHLADTGRQIIILDDNQAAGGQYFKQLPHGFQADRKSRLLRDKERFDTLARVLSRSNVSYMPNTTVWGMPSQKTVAYAGPTQSGRIQASSIVIATGAQEKSLPFPGWTLPGVISAGGCLNLAKAHGLVPTERMVVAGNGPLVLVASATMIAAGADIAAIVEAQTDINLVASAISGISKAPDILAKAIGYRWRMLRSGARFKTGWMICEAKGDGKLEKLAIAPIGADGRPVIEQCQWIEADVLVLGYGLIPGSETARVMGCQMEVRPELNGMVPIRNERLQTNVESVYAIGDGAGIGGAEIAILEGAIAAHAILQKSPPRSLNARYERLDKYRRSLNLAYARPVPLAAATSETIICRCEELTLGQLALHPSARHGHLNALKVSSRLGMGRCQGRNCLHAASSLLGLTAAPQSHHPRARPPLKPVPLSSLAADMNAGPAHEPDEINVLDQKEHP